MNSKEMAYVGQATAYLVAGRTLYRRFAEDEFDDLCSRLDELGGELEQPLVVIPGGDFTDTGIAISQTTLYCVVGLLASKAGTYPRLLDHAALTAAVARSRDLPWAAITSLLPGDDTSQLGDDVALYATACGPLAGVMVGYGVLSDISGDSDYFDEEDEARFLASEDGVAAVVHGLDLVRGNMTNQEPQPKAVYGVQVSKGLYDGGLPALVDISETAHRDRVTKLGPLVDQSNYYLIGHFD